MSQQTARKKFLTDEARIDGAGAGDMKARGDQCGRQFRGGNDAQMRGIIEEVGDHDIDAVPELEFGDFMPRNKPYQSRC